MGSPKCFLGGIPYDNWNENHAWEQSHDTTVSQPICMLASGCHCFVPCDVHVINLPFKCIERVYAPSWGNCCTLHRRIWQYLVLIQTIFPRFTCDSSAPLPLSLWVRMTHLIELRPSRQESMVLLMNRGVEVVLVLCIPFVAVFHNVEGVS